MEALAGGTVQQKSDGELPPCPFGIIEILFTEHR